MKRKPRWGRIAFLLVFLIIFSLAGIKLYTAIDYLFFTPGYGADATMPRGADKTGAREQINLLILGLDGPEADDPEKPRRSDSLVLASFDLPKQNVAMLSIPRDTLVQIPGRDEGEEEKINHAHAYGGMKLARQTAADFLGVPIDFYLTVDAGGFIKLIDTLGGIGLYVEDDMDYEDPYQNLYIHIKRGYQLMDGATAVKYVRFRSGELGDIGRVLRQQKFMEALSDQLFSLNGLLKLPALWEAAKQSFQTDLTLPGALRMARSFPHYGRKGIRFEMLPGKFQTIKGASYWETDIVIVRAAMDRLGIAYVKK
ncbi:MAG: LCP family protein [Acidaminococcales bacterium]|nr:LCP family protein [Acidaminococcales bacterium]